MVKNELIKRSPLRILEKSIQGGVGKGKIGVIASRKGVGKTACLVHIATDKLFQERHVIHVSFSTRIDHIISWYEDIFKEISKKRKLEGAMDVHDQLIKNRVIMNFNQEGITAVQLIKSLEAMIGEGAFAADAIIFDGFDFLKTSKEDMAALKQFAGNSQVELWFSATLPGDTNEPLKGGIPKLLAPYTNEISVILTLNPQNDHIHLYVEKDHDEKFDEDTRLKLDSKTLLIAEE